METTIGVSFNEARHGLLEALAEQEGLTLPAVVREYNRNAEFKSRIDIAAMSMSVPISQSMH
jgi:hypothetical protein